MAEKLTQAELDELRRTVAHAAATDIGAEWKDGADPELVEDFNNYLHHYAAPARDETGAYKKGYPCLCCGEPLSGDLASQLLGRGGFTWGIVHGQGHCRNCYWPATLYHFIKDRHGAELATIRNILLQVHPEFVGLRDEKAVR